MNRFWDTSVTQKSQKDKESIPTVEKYPVTERMHHASNITSSEKIQESSKPIKKEEFMVIFAPGGRFIRKPLCRTGTAIHGYCACEPNVWSPRCLSEREHSRLLKTWSRQGRGWNSESFDSTDSSSSSDEYDMCPHQLRPFKLCSCDLEESVQKRGISPLRPDKQKHVPVESRLSTSTKEEKDGRLVDKEEEEKEGGGKRFDIDQVEQAKDEEMFEKKEIKEERDEIREENQKYTKKLSFEEQLTSQSIHPQLAASEPPLSESSISLKNITSAEPSLSPSTILRGTDDSFIPTPPVQPEDTFGLSDSTRESIHERLVSEGETTEEETNLSLDEPTLESPPQTENATVPVGNEPTHFSNHEMVSTPILRPDANKRSFAVDDSTMDTSTSLSSKRDKRYISGRYRASRKRPPKRWSKLKTTSTKANGSRCPFLRPIRVCPDAYPMNHFNGLALSSGSTSYRIDSNHSDAAAGHPVTVRGDPVHSSSILSCNCSRDVLPHSRSGQASLTCVKCGENLQTCDEETLRAELLKYARLAERAPLVWRHLFLLILVTQILALVYLHGNGSALDFFSGSHARS